MTEFETAFRYQVTGDWAGLWQGLYYYCMHVDLGVPTDRMTNAPAQSADTAFETICHQFATQYDIHLVVTFADRAPYFSHEEHHRPLTSRHVLFFHYAPTQPPSMDWYLPVAQLHRETSFMQMWWRLAREQCCREEVDATASTTDAFTQQLVHLVVQWWQMGAWTPSFEYQCERMLELFPAHEKPIQTVDLIGTVSHHKLPKAGDHFDFLQVWNPSPAVRAWAIHYDADTWKHTAMSFNMPVHPVYREMNVAPVRRPLPDIQSIMCMWITENAAVYVEQCILNA
jgi:hypothetical protein